MFSMFYVLFLFYAFARRWHDVVWFFASLWLLLVSPSVRPPVATDQAAHRVTNLPSAYIQFRVIGACGFHVRKVGGFALLKFHQL